MFNQWVKAVQLFKILGCEQNGKNFEEATFSEMKIL